MLLPVQSNRLPNNVLYQVRQWLLRNKFADINNDKQPLSLSDNDSDIPVSNRKSHVMSYEDTKNKIIKKERAILVEQTEKLYDIVLNGLGGNKFSLSFHPHSHSQNQKEEIIKALQKEGFHVNLEDFNEIRRVAKDVRDGLLIEEKINPIMGVHFRFASLNCYDHERYKEEMSKLAEKIGYRRIEGDGPTLLRIYLDAMVHDQDDYPGRHLRYYGPNSYLSTRYRCLRILDEILCSYNTSLSLPEIRNLILKKADELRIYSDISQKGMISAADLTDDNFKKLFYILSQLINEDYTGGKQNGYKRDVFEYGGHIYKKFKDNRRLNAFALDVSLWEITLLRKEIAVIRAKYFFDDRDVFTEDFPLLSILGQLEDLAFEDDEELILNKVKETDLHTVNYEVLKYENLKKKCDTMISLGLPIIIREGKENLSVYPLSLKESADTFALIAKAIDTDEIHIISPEMLRHSSVNNMEKFSYDYKQAISNCILGTGRLIRNNPYDVKLIVTKDGYKTINRSCSTLSKLNPFWSLPEEKYYEGARKGRLVATIQVYLNEDFLQELLQLDKCGKLISVEPKEVNKIYEEFFKREFGKKRMPYDERPACKRLRNNNSQKK